MFLKVLFFLIFINQNVFGQKPKFDAKSLEKQIYNVGNVNDLAKLGISLPLKTEKLSGRKSGQFSNFQVLDDSVKDATPGKCDPKPVCISNPLTLTISSSNQVVFPACINIHRCEGCCPQNEKCVAAKSETIKLKNVGIINITVNDMVYEGNIVSVQNHTDCECRCQWENDDDCREINPNFVKSLDSCSCVCPHILKCDSIHEFDKDSCKCVCNKKNYSKMETTCKSRNMKWNEEVCRCESAKPSIKIEITRT